MLDASSAKTERRRLFDAYRSSSSPLALAAFQRLLAAAIIEGEVALAEMKVQGVRDHVDEFLYHQRRLRSLGDSIAWDHLHPHAIRQLTKQGVRAARLKDQADVGVARGPGPVRPTCSDGRTFTKNSG